MALVLGMPARDAVFSSGLTRRQKKGVIAHPLLVAEKAAYFFFADFFGAAFFVAFFIA